MNRKWVALLLALLMACAAAGFMGGCKTAAPLVIWVGVESVDFYQAQMDEYVKSYEAKYAKAFPYEIQVQGVDTSAAAAKFLDDTEAGADIFTIPHDNLGKLTAGSSAIAPITDEALLAQIQEDNPETFLGVISREVQGTEYTFGVPYVAQSLVLFYNTKYLTPEDAESWEGIWEVAKANNMQAMSLMGSDGYNNSFLTLATGEEDGATSVRIYADGNLEDCFFTGDDTVAVFQWGQRFFTDPNGGKMPTDSGWEIELRDEISLSLIGGAWKFNAAKAALGENLGIAILPTFTLTEEDVKGTDMAPGTVFRSGTFTDTKMFVMKKGSDKAEYLQEILKFLSSREIQEKSYVACANLPAYKNAAAEFTSMQGDNLENRLATCQLEMFNYGIPQPFGYSTSHNFYFYSKGAPDLMKEILENKDGLFGTTDAIRQQLALVEKIWETGSKD
ncbi:MAG: sugar ABC transporter substrate-binding protein [Christensenellales bacterium]|jgi:arabinogalactan oligomer/maltooligosaccharide transport system substrate-binding protein